MSLDALHEEAKSFEKCVQVSFDKMATKLFITAVVEYLGLKL